MPVPDVPPDIIGEANAAQRRAADPSASVWVAASAGTGKTKVLTDRVLNLLLAEADPGRILCLTFTRAAAAEMSERISRELSQWAVIDGSDLAARLEALLGRQPSQARIQLARQLFARMLDTPGGLRIQTIHAFCQAVLKRFPLEAGLPPHFRVMEDRSAAEGLREARDRVLQRAVAAPESPAGRAMVIVNRYFAEETFNELVSELLQERARLSRFLGAIGGAARIAPALAAHLGLPEGETAAAVRRAGVADSMFDVAGLRRAAEALAAGSSTDMARGDALAAFLAADTGRREVLFKGYCDAFLTGEGAIRKKLATKKVIAAFGGIDTILAREGERLLALTRRLKAHALAERSAAVLGVAAAVLDGYEAGKRRRALVDFEDLVSTVRDLLTRRGVAAWVLFKLDGGLDHILIDEAQDTNPEQWEVIQALTEEFFAGEGAETFAEAEKEGKLPGRSIFAVGDVKQSIFSFQRADPEGFLRMRRHFAKKVNGAACRWEKVDMEVSFRSGAAVLGLVDSLFNSRPAGAGVLETQENGELLPVRHGVSRGGDAGLVEIWPPFLPAAGKQNGKQGGEETLPLVQRAVDNPASRLAEAIAARIRRWLDQGEILPSAGRPVRPGDIMVLVRRRSDFVHEMVRALKQRNVDVAGVDRMVLGEQIAVMDLIALGRFLLLPEDDLTLATVLKSPLIGLDEEALMKLACGRGEARLWHELQRRAAGDAVFARAARLLRSWLARADMMPPYELFAGILVEEEEGEASGRTSGRKRILARLGSEAADPLDEFLAQAIEYERGHIPSLQGFLHWLEAADSDIKRDMEGGEGGRVRVMTVHGSKGLQAPVVFMPDTMQMPQGRAKILWSHGTGAGNTGAGVPVPLCAPAKGDDVAASAAAKAAAAQRQVEEYRRLLYVAMTRAGDRLYVAGWEMKRKPPEGTWYELVRTAMTGAGAGAGEGTGAGAEEVQDPEIAAASGSDLPLLRIETPQTGQVKAPDIGVSQTAARLPLWVSARPEPEPVPPRPLMPSRPGDPEPAMRSPLAAAERGRFRRGQLIHRLLQLLPDLPAARRRAAGQAFLARPLHGLAASGAAEYLEEVMTVLEHPEWAALFGPGSRAEVPIVGQAGDIPEAGAGGGGGIIVSGRIDRLLVQEGRVTVVDYKTNRPPPRHAEDIPVAYLRQMAAYRALLRRMFAGHEIRCLLLWTDGPFVSELPEALLDGHIPGGMAVRTSGG